MLINGRPAFPLEKWRNRLHGYFLTHDDDVYSTRQGSTPRKLYGSHNMGQHWYTLDNLKYSKREIMSGCKMHVDYRFVMNATRNVAATPDVITPQSIGAEDLLKKLKDRTHAKSLSEGIGAKGSIIATFEDGKLHFGSTPAIHMTPQSLKAEMERLAILRPGVKFVSLQITGSVVAAGVTWE
jgi:hypothetical protein